MSSPSPTPLDLDNVQGDILWDHVVLPGNTLGLTFDRAGLPKKSQTYYFFTIDEHRVQGFRTQLAHLIPLITTTAQVVGDQANIAAAKETAAEEKVAPPLLKLSGVNIAFTQEGLVQLGINNEKIGDTAFEKGMLADAVTLGDLGAASPSGPDWIPAFKQHIHGMVLVSGDSHKTVAEQLAKVKDVFCVGSHDAVIHEVIQIVGHVRPGKEKGHEHFGFLDGISQPAVQGFDTNPNPGQETVPAGIILLGREGDTVTRPSWALDGSFISFRYLFQLVPEFNEFTKANAIPGLPVEQGSELLRSRLVGRWKSGAPVDLAPTTDDPSLGADPLRNNNFSYNFPDDQKTQDRCPFAAHIRKTNPRGDLEDPHPPTSPQSIPTTIHRIIRRGIQFGPEVSADEAASGTTTRGRGLLFAAYQSNIGNGFEFLQQSWANNPAFPPFKAPITPGWDPIIGQIGPETGVTVEPTARVMSGTNPNSQSANLNLTAQWVVPKGGAYLFAPSIAALKETFALA
ncbi:hypothetical protein MMC11_006227 [Xylographa trunciseda]|nr:hypothetical protein [Xylographa trunciseda]